MGEGRYVLIKTKDAFATLHAPGALQSLKEKVFTDELIGLLIDACAERDSDEVDITEIVKKIPKEKLWEIFEKKSEDKGVIKVQFRSIPD